MNNEERADLIERHIIMLREHFDSVHIVAARREGRDDDTVVFSIGKGSWYERVGLMREAVMKADERDRLEVQRKMEDENDD